MRQLFIQITIWKKKIHHNRFKYGLQNEALVHNEQQAKITIRKPFMQNVHAFFTFAPLLQCMTHGWQTQSSDTIFIIALWLLRTIVPKLVPGVLQKIFERFLNDDLRTPEDHRRLVITNWWGRWAIKEDTVLSKMIHMKLKSARLMSFIVNKLFSCGSWIIGCSTVTYSC